MRPPGRSILTAFEVISRCRSAKKSGRSGVQVPMTASSFRNMPSPEHGASTRILSKKPGKTSARPAGVSLVTSTFSLPNSSRLRSSALARALLMSLATRRPVPFRRAFSSVALPPGAAQRSSTRSPGSIGRRDAGVMALGSCR